MVAWSIRGAGVYGDWIVDCIVYDQKYAAHRPAV